MGTTSTQTTIGELVRAAPVRARIFEKLGINYCCGGKKPLADVCATKGLDPATVLAMLDALETAQDTTIIDAEQMSLTALCDHIEQTHHQYLREELPRLDFMTRKVAVRHGEHEPRLIEIRQVFEAFAPDLVEHVLEEEKVHFPRIRQLEAADEGKDPEALRSALSELEQEHQNAGAALARFRELTDDFTPPEWACNTFRALYDGLARLEENMHQHVHKENSILFPRLLATG